MYRPCEATHFDTVLARAKIVVSKAQFKQEKENELEGRQADFLKYADFNVNGLRSQGVTR